MNSWEVLNIAKTQDKAAILAGLQQKVADKDFKSDLPEIFRHIKAYHQIMAALEQQAINEEKYFPERVGFSKEEIILPYIGEDIYETPEQLTHYFSEIYGNLASRFNILYWKSAIVNAKRHSVVDLKEYCLPIINFLNDHLYVKSDVFHELRSNFPLLRFFMSEEWNSLKNDNEYYDYIEFLIINGNVELDVQVDTLLEQIDSSQQMDAMLDALARSSNLARQGSLAQAFNILAENISEEVKPLLIKQREVNLLFKAAVLEKQEEALPHFIGVLNQSLQRFPDDTHLLYLRAVYLAHTLSPEAAQKEIIVTLKAKPTITKCFFLLGKSYLETNLDKEAHEIFAQIASFEPLQLEYCAYQAIALQKILEAQKQLVASDLGRAAYMERMFQLIDINQYEEIAETPKRFQDDRDFMALQLYAEVCERHYYEDKAALPTLYQALEMAQMPELVLRLVRKKMSFHKTFAEIAEQKDFLTKYLAIFPDDDEIHFNLGSCYFHIKDYPKALEHYKKANQLNPANMHTFLGVARVAEFLKEYTMAIKYIGVYLHAYRYDKVGYEILARCAINTKDFLLAYRCYRWIIHIDAHASPEVQFYLVNTLGAYIRNTSINLANNSLFVNDLQAVVALFESLPKGEDFRQHPKGRVAYFWAAILCKFAMMHEKGLEFLDKAIDICNEIGEKDLGDIAKNKAEFLIALGRHKESINFLIPYVAYLQKHLPQEKLNVVTLGFYIASSYEKLNQMDDAYEWRMLNIERYYDIEGHDQAWLEDYIIGFFFQCMESNNLAQVKEVGNLYLLAIEEPCHNHVYVSYWLADSYAQEGNATASTELFQKVVAYGSQFPEDYPELVESAKLKLVQSI